MQLEQGGLTRAWPGLEAPIATVTMLPPEGFSPASKA